MWVIFAVLDPDPDPLTRLNPDPILIRNPAFHIDISIITSVGPLIVFVIILCVFVCGPVACLPSPHFPLSPRRRRLVVLS